MSRYFTAGVAIPDRELFKWYEGGFDEILAPYEGEVVAVDNRPMQLEGSSACTRVVVIRFPCEARACVTRPGLCARGSWSG